MLMVTVPPWSARAAQYDYIDISNPFLRKTPVAVPAFQARPQVPAAVKAASETAHLVAYYLDFSGYFTISDPAAFLEDPRTMDIKGPGIRYRNWTAMGAELLVTGGVEVTGEEAQFELRLFDTVKEKLLIGKRYRGALDDYPRVARRFCSEILYAVVGSRGFFDSKLAFVSNGTGHKEIYI